MALLAADASVMHSLGLPLLPSSVLVKSDGGVVKALTTALVSERFGLVFVFVICGLFIGGFTAWPHRLGRATPEARVGSVIAFALAAHLVGGRYGWFSRYEVYAVAMSVTGGIYLLRGAWHGIEGQALGRAQIGMAAILAVVVLPYAVSAVRTPSASRNIYEQQFQMHRFATDFYPQRVAVNDLGWVSYRNDAFVLDLWGLGSEKVRRLRRAGHFGAREVQQLVDDSAADFAMVYRSWLSESIPPDWCLMAVMDTEPVTAADRHVDFYATRPGAQAAMNAALDRFAPTLPRRVGLTRFACAR